MVWGAMLSIGTITLQIVKGRMNVLRYVEMLKNASLNDEGRKFCGDNWIFQQDNAPIHNVRASIKFFQDEGIVVLHGHRFLLT